MTIKVYQGENALDDMLNDMLGIQLEGEALYRRLPPALFELLKPGDHYVSIQHIGDGFLIFGEIIESEYEEDREMMAQSPWLRLVRAWSEVYPPGELGHEFVSTLLPISNEAFEEAKARQWKVDPRLAADWSRARLAEVGLTPADLLAARGYHL